MRIIQILSWMGDHNYNNNYNDNIGNFDKL